MPDNIGSVALWGTIFAGIGGLIGVICKHYLQIKADKRVGIQQKEETSAKGYEFVITQLNAQNEKLEKERKEQILLLSTALEALRIRELDCVKIQEGLRVQNIAQQQDIAQLQAEVVKLQGQVVKLEGK